MKSRYLVLGLSIVLALALAVPALGGPSNPIASISATVKQTANKALKKAKEAQTTANTALTAASDAQTTAKSAQTAASKAQTSANNAQATANVAKATADQAKTAAATAQATANSKFGGTFTEFGGFSGANNASGFAIQGCPAGSSVTGGGFETGGAGTEEVVPVFTAAYGNAWFASLQRIPGGAQTWTVRAIVTCAKP